MLLMMINDIAEFKSIAIMKYDIELRKWVELCLANGKRPFA